ncbi:alpha,alpha-phosphotrehalase [Fusobacterium perfoetens]|uniref:alpha,alpha-phosphotrehalase n=1 Tax=Fusobacterium perfoetens TaxID=852 RepID=UPI000489EE1E|nr:alpha,alpha-phosphotrehalase [Fusobacterium perfoetens]
MSFKNKVVYQIYPKSFYDSNNDGIGDLKGITKKLKYLNFLGIDYIWITPFFVSPQRDNGYDVADYYNIDPLYGTMEDLDELILEASKYGIKLMLDMVFNHTSTEHIWFKQAIQGNKKYQNYYFFKKSIDNKLPTNWVSKFGGNTWEYCKELDMYYLHLFDKTQADLNWENPEVRKEMTKIVNFWINKGIEGFRFDVVNLISKPQIFKDDFIGDGRRFYTDGPNIHSYLKELNKNSFGKLKNIVTVGEMSSTTIENCYKYSGEKENELSMVFSFHHLKIDYKNKNKWELQEADFEELKEILNTWQLGMQKNNAWNALFWCNHDQPRIVSRLGDDKIYWKKSAKMLATMIHCLRGTPYIYQGEEIGMTNTYFETINDFKDIESLNYYDIFLKEGKSPEEALKIIQERSRDNGRTPMQWNNKNFGGFSNIIPWINPIKNFKQINVENQINDCDSILHYYKKLIQLRKNYLPISEGEFIPVITEKDIYIYKRKYNSEEILVILNYKNKKEITLPKEEIEKNYSCILSNNNIIKLTSKLTLEPFDTFVFYKK